MNPPITLEDTKRASKILNRYKILEVDDNGMRLGIRVTKYMTDLLMKNKKGHIIITHTDIFNASLTVVDEILNFKTSVKIKIIAHWIIFCIMLKNLRTKSEAYTLNEYDQAKIRRIWRFTLRELQ